jgi:hypothetical protein
MNTIGVVIERLAVKAKVATANSPGFDDAVFNNVHKKRKKSR